MKTSTDMPTKSTPPEVVSGIRKRLMQVAVSFILQAALLFGGSGKVQWIWAWVFLAICALSMAVNATFMFRANPETIAERSRIGETTGWDKLIGGLWALFLFLLAPAIAGLDERFDWTQPFQPAWNLSGAAMLALGLGLAGWAMIANAYFSTAVRIQYERGHAVCKTGPYRFVRHPGYVGFILQSIGTPLLLGSWWAVIPGGIAAIMMAVRTALEDRWLQGHLEGYADYVQEVRYRLVPGFW